MRTALITDIHSNLHALEAVLKDIDATGVDRIVCLGDTVDGGAYPTECIDLVQDRCEYILCGNHEAMHIDARYDKKTTGNLQYARERWFTKRLPGIRLETPEGPWWRDAYSGHEHETTRYTASCLRSYSPLSERKDDIQWIRSLPTSIQEPGIMYVHGAPAPTTWGQNGDFLFPGENLALRRAWQHMASQETQVAFVGHTHRRTFFSTPRGGSPPGCPESTHFDMPDGRTLDLNERMRHIIVCCSAGAPYDGDPRPGWVLHDHGKKEVTLRRVKYDLHEACNAISRTGVCSKVLNIIQGRIRNAGDPKWKTMPNLNDPDDFREYSTSRE